MFQWGKDQGIKNVKLLPDGSGNFTRGMNMAVKKDDVGFGERSWRYSMFVDNGKIEKMFIEPGFQDNCPTDPFETSGVDSMLDYLKNK